MVTALNGKTEKKPERHGKRAEKQGRRLEKQKRRLRKKREKKLQKRVKRLNDRMERLIAFLGVLLCVVLVAIEALDEKKQQGSQNNN